MSTVTNCICLHTLITVRKRSLLRLCFYKYLYRGGGGLQAHIQKGVWGVSTPIPRGAVEGSGWRGVSRPIPNGEVRGVAWGVSRQPRPRGEGPGPGGGVYPSMH